jgi:uncharacterized protein YndB with AHSA1/START domain
MTKMANTEFVYTTYIKTTPEKAWQAITNPEFTRQYWGVEIHSDWKPGSKWNSVMLDGERNRISGEIVEATPPQRLVYTWVSADAPSAPASRVTFEIAKIEEMVKLHIVHDKLELGSDMATRVSAGWPRVLASLKSFLETGEALNTWAGFEHACGAGTACGAENATKEKEVAGKK